MSTKQDALEEIVTIVRNNKLALDDIIAALKDPTETAVKESSGIIARLFGYIGGILLLAGICILVGNNWQHFNSAARVVVTLGTGFSAFLFALAAMGHPKYDRAATPLMLMAVFFQPVGIFVMLDEYSKGGEPLHGVLFMASVMLVQQAAVFWQKQRTTLAFTSIFFGGTFFATLMELQDIPEEITALTLGAAVMCISWALSRSPHRPIAAFWYFIGSVSVLCASFDILDGTPFEVLFLGLSALFIYISTAIRSRTLLLVGTTAMLSYIGYFTYENFKDNDLWPLGLMICGVALIGLGAGAMRINAKYIRAKA